MSAMISINRIRLEFKAHQELSRSFLRVLVLIESDWNLKEEYAACGKVIMGVLIESDWNLKFCIPANFAVCIFQY